MDDFAGRPGVALVTGGTGGIGAAVCRRLARTGTPVLFTYRSDQDAAAALRAELAELAPDAGPFEALRLDLGDPDATAALLTDLVEHHGGVHTVVHAAGPRVRQEYLSAVSPEEFGRHLAAEAAAFYHLAHAALPALRAAGGSLTVVTTAATRRHPARDGLSTGPKGAVEATAKALAVEEGRYGVRVNCVGPGMLTDGMSAALQEEGQLPTQALEKARANIPLRSFGTGADVAEAVAFLASDRAAYITGQKLDVDGGYGA